MKIRKRVNTNLLSPYWVRLAADFDAAGERFKDIIRDCILPFPVQYFTSDPRYVSAIRCNSGFA